MGAEAQAVTLWTNLFVLALAMGAVFALVWLQCPTPAEIRLADLDDEVERMGSDMDVEYYHVEPGVLDAMLESLTNTPHEREPMKTPGLIEGLVILQKYRTTPDDYHTQAEHDELYASGTDLPLLGYDLDRMVELGWTQPEVDTDDWDFAAKHYDPDESWSYRT